MILRLSRTLRVLLTALFWACVAGLVLFLSALVFVVRGFSGTGVLPTDCAIVFGTAVRPVFDAQGDIIYTGPGPGILRRVSAAAELYRAGMAKTIFLSGGKGEGMVESEASVMQRIAVVKGIALTDIVIEDESRSTAENLQNVFPLLRRKGCKTTVGVSDRYHLARIRLLAERSGHPIATYPAEATAGAAFETHSVVREALGVMFIAFQILLT